MVIEGIPYARVEGEVLCSTSACLYMFLSFYKVKSTPAEMAEIFNDTFMSRGFNEWYTHSLDMGKYEENAMLCCAQYMINNRYPHLVAGIVPSTIEKTRLSYIKRRIPVMVTGRFPLLSGRISNTVLLKGYVDGYIIANDPRGNANSGYIDRYGENMVYTVGDLASWATLEKSVYLLRIISK
jgi:hypothetical protein